MLYEGCHTGSTCTGFWVKTGHGGAGDWRVRNETGVRMANEDAAESVER